MDSASILVALITKLLIFHLAAPCDLLRARPGQSSLCYRLNRTTTTFFEADKACGLLGGYLPIPNSPEENDVILGILKQEKFTSVWLGLMSHKDDFKWISDERPVGDQGCYSEPLATYPDMYYTHEVSPNMTVPRCLQGCREKGYKYAGLKFGNTCKCGDRYGRYNLVYNCRLRCAGDSSTFCGGPDAVQVYNVHGTYAAWEMGQPNNLNNRQACVMMDKQSQHQWVDTECRTVQGAICQSETPEENCTGANQTWISGQCFTFIREPHVWFRALMKCRQNGGKLVELRDPTVHQHVLSFARRPGFSDRSYWMGMTHRMWKWNTGAFLTFSMWESRQPNGVGQNCASISRITGRWSDVYCDSYMRAICVIDPDKPRVYSEIARYSTEPWPTMPYTTPMTTNDTWLSNSTDMMISDNTTHAHNGTTEEQQEESGPAIPTKYLVIIIGVGSAFLVLIVLLGVSICIMRGPKQREARAEYYYGIDIEGNAEENSPENNSKKNSDKKDKAKSEQNSKTKETDNTNGDDSDSAVGTSPTGSTAEEHKEDKTHDE